ncbi:hypothetical protein HYU22_02185 [Candidatus Woesearchaeota archaeon]|nr:hypothetical protein [Candidatus Woesearchaeota archaeon]
MTTNDTGSVGTAYGFFYYGGRASQISQVLPKIRKRTETPLELALEVVEGVDNLNTGEDSGLTNVVRRAHEAHMSHVLQATVPAMGNRRAANFVGNIMNGIYAELYDRTEPFNAGIVYQRGEQYVFRRK